VSRYQHDCDECKPLGQHDEFDLYYCDQHGMPTVIARFGEDGDYMSGMCFANSGPLKEARTRAIVLDYIKAGDAPMRGALDPKRSDLMDKTEVPRG
jgi:hypothetical protein